MSSLGTSVSQRPAARTPSPEAHTVPLQCVQLMYSSTREHEDQNIDIDSKTVK